MKTVVLIFMCLLPLSCAATTAPDSAPDRLPDFVPAHVVTGEIKIWGSPADAQLIKAWADGFEKFNPDARIVAALHGPDSTLAGVYTGVADLAFMAREIKEPVEQMAFTWVYRYPPFSVEIANAGVRTNRLCANLAIFVNKDNPLANLTLAQLDAILGAEHRRNQKNIRMWGELGLDGSWKDRPIHVYGPPVDSVAALYIREVVLKGSRKWNPDYWELSESGDDLLNGLAKDLDGIAYAPLNDANGNVKPLALGDGEAFVNLTPKTVASRAYPLTRSIAIVLNRPPRTPIEPKIKEFLRFILSRQGQEAIEQDGGYIPLNAATLQQQLQLLD